jgi:hypothetical protein
VVVRAPFESPVAAIDASPSGNTVGEVWIAGREIYQTNVTKRFRHRSAWVRDGGEV